MVELRQLIARGVVGVFAAGVVGLASAQVLSYDAFRTQFYTQTSDSAPVTPDTYQFYARIFLTNQADAASGTLTDPGSNNYGMPEYLLDPILHTYYLFYGDATPTSQAQEDARYTAGQYTFTLNGGTNGYDGNQATVNVGPDDFATTVPFLTSGTYSKLQGMNASNAITLKWNNFNDSLGTSQHQTFLDVFDESAGGTLVYNNNGLSGSYTSDTIASGTFIAGHQYEYTLFFSSRFYQASGVSDPSNAFYAATGLSAFDFGTNGYFTAAPEPISVAGLAAGVVALMRRRRK